MKRKNKQTAKQMPMDPKNLKNAYFVMRHGQSLANVRGLIVSHPDNGVPGYGLSGKGKDQAAAAFEACPDLDAATLIVSSDFLRTKQTAQIAARVLASTGEIRFTPLLRERSFGKYELKGSGNYETVWNWDARQQSEPDSGVESVEQVLERGMECIRQIEAAHENRRVLLVSHGDTLQILMTFFNGLPPHRHRELLHLETAEIRRLDI